jgi:hypothetical protein
VPPEEYTLSGVDCPLGTMVGPGRYGMYWVARRHTPLGTGTVFRSAMPTDFTGVLSREEPYSVAEADLRRKRGVIRDDNPTGLA